MAKGALTEAVGGRVCHGAATRGPRLSRGWVQVSPAPVGPLGGSCGEAEAGGEAGFSQLTWMWAPGRRALGDGLLPLPGHSSRGWELAGAADSKVESELTMVI